MTNAEAVTHRFYVVDVFAERPYAGNQPAVIVGSAERSGSRESGEPASDQSYSTPDFVARGFYVDMPFACKACGQAQVWTAAQQKWWHESAKGDVWTIAVLCRPCRLRERKRKSAARSVHLAGLAKKAQRET
jgi:hypothetical protein